MLELNNQITQIVEVAGVVTILAGGMLSTAYFFTALRTRAFDEAYRGYHGHRRRGPCNSARPGRGQASSFAVACTR